MHRDDTQAPEAMCRITSNRGGALNLIPASSTSVFFQGGSMKIAAGDITSLAWNTKKERCDVHIPAVSAQLVSFKSHQNYGQLNRLTRRRMGGCISQPPGIELTKCRNTRYVGNSRVVTLTPNVLPFAGNGIKSECLTTMTDSFRRLRSGNA